MFWTNYWTMKNLHLFIEEKQNTFLLGLSFSVAEQMNIDNDLFVLHV